MKDISFILSSSPEYIENIYQLYINNPDQVDIEFRNFFAGFDFAINQYGQKNQLNTNAETLTKDIILKEMNVYRLISAYRSRGHLVSKTNPIRPRKDRGAKLSHQDYGLTDSDLNQSFFVGEKIGLGKTTLKEIISFLQQTYTGSVGIEYTYINEKEKIQWLHNEFEKKFIQPISFEKRKRILSKLNQSVLFEKFLNTKFVGQKRFSLEGGENTIPALDEIIQTAAQYNVEEVVIGMAHRGRLNVLANIMHKTYEEIFSEFTGKAAIDETMGSGDVKYHLGYSSIYQAECNKDVVLQLINNPSHLETVNAVAIGYARSKTDQLYQNNYTKVLPILIHGDASLAGQGIVYELLQMYGLKGYQVGGTIHFVINNQIGFTTDFEDARSSNYCTSLSAITQSPVFHVNGDDAEAIAKCANIATRYRQEFGCDVFIDMLCYRKHGHNEGDDPKYTQPWLYKLIADHPDPRAIYTEFLVNHVEPKVQALAKEMEQSFWNDLQDRLEEVKQHPIPYTYQKPEEEWKKLKKATEKDFYSSPNTAISKERLVPLVYKILSYPTSFIPLQKVDKLLQEKKTLFQNEQKIDWATGELLAYASLLEENKIVRLSGEDVERGTFSHRHVIIRNEDKQEYNRLSNISPLQEKGFFIYNSLLSEYAVLGYEFGYAMANPNALVLWEAQFGDFANGAQIIIDQYISSAEEKWGKMNGIVLLLPHGYEGQGPEHSSARIERYLQMCAELNMVVTNITSSANLFHALRRQLAWNFRKPLIIFTPKANLRSPYTYSSVIEFTTGKFQEIIDDKDADASIVKKVIFCSGKIYFELLEEKNKQARKDVALIRIEQIHPFPIHIFTDLYQTKYKSAQWFWVQEEPFNMGAASFLNINIRNQFNFGIIARKAAASTATGYNKIHQQEQKEIIEKVFSI